jgi:hypothetical protein
MLRRLTMEVAVAAPLLTMLFLFNPDSAALDRSWLIKEVEFRSVMRPADETTRPLAKAFL